MRTIERNYRKHPHTARFLATFHTAAYGLPSDAEPIGEDLLALVPETTEDNRSPRQVELMGSLIAQITELDPALGAAAGEWTAKATASGVYWTAGREGTASAWITKMIAKVKELKTAQAAAPRPVAAPTGITEDGMYLFEGKIYKVQFAVNGSGRLYAKLLVQGAEGENATFQYAHGVVTKLRPEHKMTLEQAKEFGALYGTCIRCGKTLTDEFSIANGLGKVCITKF